MTISAALKDAFRAYKEHFGNTVKFLIVEACITLAALTPLLFLTDSSLKVFALLAVPLWILLVFWGRVNAADGMRDSLRGGSLFSYKLIDPSEYGKKLAYGLKRMLMLLFWSVPLIACLVIAKIHYSGDMDGFTLLRGIKDFGGGELMTGVLYLIAIFVGAVLLVAFGCAFHSGDRHAFIRNNPKMLRGHHGKIVLCWCCGDHPLPAGAAGPERSGDEDGQPALHQGVPDYPGCGRSTDYSAAAAAFPDSRGVCERTGEGVIPVS